VGVSSPLFCHPMGVTLGFLFLSPCSHSFIVGRFAAHFVVSSGRLTPRGALWVLPRPYARSQVQ
jgi:hypothetical protein